MESKIVDPKNIESELTAIWDALEGQGTMRSCLYNLIIYSSKSERCEYLKEIAQKTIDKFPSRVLFITIGDEPLKTEVSAIRSNKIACDFIDISLNQDQKHLVPFLILPHLVCDLPTYLLWADDPACEDETFKEIKKLATRIIYDSESSSNLADFARCACTDLSKPIADLNWARIAGWRALISSLFRDVSVLQNTAKIHITYNSHQTQFFTHTHFLALYLQAYLSSSMSWQFKHAKQNERHIQLDYEGVEIILEPVSFEQIAPGRIVTIEIESKNKDHTLLQRSPDIPHQIIIQQSTATQCSLPTYFIFAKYESGQSLVNEICKQGTSEHFLKSLSYLQGIKL